MVIILRALWHYKGFVFGLVQRDFSSRYLNSILGSLWSILNPLANILVYTLIFSQVMRSRLPGIDDTLAYSIYLCAGLLPWNYFSETLLRMQNVFIDQGNLLKKVSFPRSALPLYILISSTINFLIIYALFIGFLLIVGKFPGDYIFGIIPLLVLQQCFAVGVGIFVATLNVFFRDVGHVIGVIMQFWFWFTPIVYSLQTIPESFKSIFQLNVMGNVIRGYQDIFLYNRWPEWSSLYIMIIITCFFLIVGYLTFKKLDREMVDEL